jgi:hypothetical protein
MLLDHLYNIIAWDSSFFYDNAPWSLPPLFHNNVLAASRRATYFADFFRTSGASRAAGVWGARAAAAHHDFFLSSDCSTTDIGKGIKQPDDKEEASDAAEDDAHGGAGTWSSRVVVSRYYAGNCARRDSKDFAERIWRCGSPSGEDVVPR